MEYIPWDDDAVAVCDRKGGHPGERLLVAQGTLAEIIGAVAQKIVELDPTLVISLPDRKVAPFRYNVQEIGRLIAMRRIAHAAGLY